MNFMEAYADSYAGLTSYLQDKDKSIFSKIHNLRLAQFKELKASDNLTIKKNPNDNSIAEVYSGLFSTSRYSNYLSSQYIKENIVDSYVLPNNDYKLLIKLILTNNIECEENKIFKLKEVIKNLKDETKDYLYNSYKSNPKIKIESIPKLNNKSNVELLEQFKNRYNDLEAKYSLKEISIPY